MKLSAKSRYGLKAMYYLAINNKKAPLSLKTIANFSEVSSPYLEKLLGVLRQKELVFSTRGVNGGYSLNRKPSEITVGDVVRALEGDVLKVDCISKKCDNVNCPSKAVFSRLYKDINEVLDNITVQDMLNNN